MTKRFDLYGWESSSLDAAAKQMGKALAVTLELHESSYRGGDYYLWRDDGGREVVIQRNFEDEEGCLAEPNYRFFLILLYASELDAESYEVLGALAGLTLLRTEVL